MKQETRVITWSERLMGNKRVRPGCPAMEYGCPGCEGGLRGCVLVSLILMWTWRESGGFWRLILVLVHQVVSEKSGSMRRGLRALGGHEYTWELPE